MPRGSGTDASRRVRDAEEKKRLLDQATRHVAELTALQEVSAALAAELDLRSVLQLVAEKTCILTGAETASVSLVDPQKQTRTHVASFGRTAERLQGRTLPATEGLHG